MPRTTIRTEDIADSEITTSKILDGTIATGDMAVDPTNASNLSSGSVPSAQLGNVDTAGLEDDIALLGFRVASNGSLAKYNLVDQTIDDFQDSSGIDDSASTNESRDSSGKYYSGVSVTDDSPTGGTETTYGSTKVNTFLADDDFVVTSSGNVDMLLIAGGGGGGDNGGGAGGAGGARVLTSIAVTAQTYAIDVGAGGANMTNGSNSTALGYTATGGGKGSSWNGAGSSGGSGGGGSGQDGGGGTSGGSGNSGGYTRSEGNSGGGGGHTPGSNAGGGGGGGAGGGGGTYSNPNGGAGGGGIANAYRTGSNVVYAGGGGGGGFYGSNGATTGGGGVAPAAGDANTGGGGGGGYHYGQAGTAGGSGIVVIKYADDEFQSSAPADLTLVSNSTTSQVAPTKGDIVLTYTNGAGSTTLGTDLTAEFSADNGSTWTSMTLGSEGTTGSHNIATAHDVSLTSTSGTSMRYRIKTLNQSGSKTTRIQAVSLGWS